MDSQPWDWSSVGGDAGTSSSSQPQPEAARSRAPQPEQASSSAPRPDANSRRRRYGTRSCRICLDSEQPKFPEESTTFGININSSRPTYTSDDPELGRLVSPCKCKGSQKYVHEGCLNAWRLANPTATRNYWQCPTCKFQYRMARLTWASMLSSWASQVGLTVVVLVISLFILGFIADPLFDLWFDPFGTVTDTITNVVSDIEANRQASWEPPTTWTDHFTKGFFSLGLVGLVKSMFAMGPWHWFQVRNSFGAGRRQGNGRARAENMSWIFIVIGAFTFLTAVWKIVKSLSARVLKRVSDSVVDIGEDDDGDDDEDDTSRKDQ